MRLFVGISFVGLAIFSTGCEGYNALAHQQDIERTTLRLEPLTPPALEDQVPQGSVPTASGMQIPPPRAQNTGTYSFVTPPTVTRVKRSTESFEQYQLYDGQPAPSDTPFVVIWVGKDPKAESTLPNTNLKADGTRSYLFNGLMAQEWSGYTADKHLPFVELILTRPGGGDKLHVVAIPKDPEIRKMTMEILNSIHWQEKP
ncbi:MAG: hypothetical protein WCI73_08600, partial [Phycisphaerae bacterium]